MDPPPDTPGYPAVVPKTSRVMVDHHTLDTGQHRRQRRVFTAALQADKGVSTETFIAVATAADWHFPVTALRGIPRLVNILNGRITVVAKAGNYRPRIIPTPRP